jgi:hypothetical protein
MSIEITDHFKNQIEDASRRSTKNILATMSPIFEENKLFDTDDKKSGKYITSSSLSHLKDAWNYFGQAINAVLKNDVALSKHFSYYSELRSSLSLMASEGIAIYDGEHYYIDSNEHVRQFTRESGSLNKLGTHQMIWTSLEAEQITIEIIVHNLMQKRVNRSFCGCFYPSCTGYWVCGKKRKIVIKDCKNIHSCI